MDLFRMAIAAVVAIVVGIPFILATRHMRHAGEKEWQDAARAGRVTTGKLKDKVFLPPDMSSPHSKMRKIRWKAKYEYDVDGGQYAYFCIVKAPVPERVDLYYPEGRPDRAALRSAMVRKRGPAYTLWALFPVAIWIVVYWVLPTIGISGT
jgi:hypothetical protein